MIRHRLRFLVVCASACVGVGFTATTSLAQVVAPLAAPSDDRAQFVPGNVVTCAGAGIVSTPGVDIIQVGAQQNNPASDPNVSGVVSEHAGGGEELNVTITGGPTVVVDAVIVKGGDGYNKYSNPTVLPPTLATPQHYISPLVGGGNVPRISHWFICYHVTDPLPTGTLEVVKQILLPDGVPVTPLPTTFSALVNCDDENPAHENVVVTFGAGGGRQSDPLLTGIPIGTVCTVVETSGNAPVVTYTPAGSDSPGVTITEGPGVVVSIINDFSGVAVQRGTIHFEKVLAVVPPGVTPPPSFTVEIACDDGTTAQVTLPGSGGPGTPDVSVRTLSFCAFIEAPASLPGGWTVTYAVDGGTPTAIPPIIPVLSTSTVTVSVINDASAVEPPQPSPTTTTIAPTTTVAPTTTSAPTTSLAGGGGETLPPTGASDWPLVVGLAMAAGGVLLIGITRRRA